MIYIAMYMYMNGDFGKKIPENSLIFPTYILDVLHA